MVQGPVFKDGVIPLGELWQTAVTVIIAILGSGGFWAILQRRSDAKDINKRMLLGLAHDKLLYLLMKYVDRGSVSADEFENVHKYLYLPYKEMGGNGIVEKLMREVERLPIKEKG